MALWRLVGGIGLGQQELSRYRARGEGGLACVRVADRAGERERHPEVAIDRHQVGTTGIAMQYATGAAFLAEDPRRVIVRVEHVHDQRLAELARDPDVSAKDLLLEVALPGTAVEPALADRDRVALGEPGLQ